MHSSSTVEYKKEYQELKAKLSLAMKELEQKNIDLITFDQERDAANNELDKKC